MFIHQIIQHQKTFAIPVKTNTIYKRAHNQCLDLIREVPLGSAFGTEVALARDLGVSRTTLRQVLDDFVRKGYLQLVDRRKMVIHHPDAAEAFPLEETESIESVVERKFMEWTLRGDCRVGQPVNGLDLARQFGVSQSAMREYLRRFSNFGFLKKHRSSGWVFLGFDRAFAEELCDIREVFELRSVERFCDLPQESSAWRRLAQMERLHVELLADIDHRYCDFSALDERLHALIYSACKNRFIDGFHENMRIIFHYHYLWNKQDEKERNTIAVREHLAYMAALKSRDRSGAVAAATAHLRSARLSLLRSI